MLKSYREKTRWDAYKQKILTDVLGPIEHQAKRRDVIERVKASSTARAQSRVRDSRLISMLQRQNDPQMTLEEVDPPGMALDEPILGDHDDFESRLMREVDEKLTDDLKLMAINPGHGIRRTSCVDPDHELLTLFEPLTSENLATTVSTHSTPVHNVYK